MDKDLKELHEKLLQATANYHMAEFHLMDLIREAETKKLHLHKGYQSLHAWLVNELKLSEAKAYNFIVVTRKSTEIPEICEAIQKGLTSVSKIRKICPVLDNNNKENLISQAINLTSRELEKVVAGMNPKARKRDVKKTVSDDVTRLSFDVDEEFLEFFNRCKDLMVSNRITDLSMAEVLKEAMMLWLDRHDPLEKAKRAEARKEKEAITVDSAEEKARNDAKEAENPLVLVTGLAKAVSITRNQILKSTQHRVNQRDRGQCQFVSLNGKRCGCTRHLHRHHKIPLSMGGSNHPDNLITLCSAHHRLVHQHLSKG